MPVQEPHEPPQPSSPHFLAPHVGTHGQRPQSCGQPLQVSPALGWQEKSPHVGIGQQSLEQESHVSPASQLPLPHWIGQTPQSVGQPLHDSPTSHAPLPHTGGHAPQSPGQFEQFSVLGAQRPSPQDAGITAHAPLLPHTLLGGHVPHEPPQVSAPHCFTLPSALAHCGMHVLPQPPQALAWHLLTQLLSHALEQQNGSRSHTHFSQPQPLQPGTPGVAEQPSLGGHLPQSLAQLEHVSPCAAAQRPSPQTGLQVPQSLEHVPHVSVPLQVPSPHVVGQLPPHEPQIATHLLTHADAAQNGSGAERSSRKDRRM